MFSPPSSGFGKPVIEVLLNHLQVLILGKSLNLSNPLFLICAMRSLGSSCLPGGCEAQVRYVKKVFLLGRHIYKGKVSLGLLLSGQDFPPLRWMTRWQAPGLLRYCQEDVNKIHRKLGLFLFFVNTLMSPGSHELGVSDCWSNRHFRLGDRSSVVRPSE